MAKNFKFTFGMALFPDSSNAKTGDIPQVYSAPSTCAARCPFKKGVCYAKDGHTGMWWKLVAECSEKVQPRIVEDENSLRSLVDWYGARRKAKKNPRWIIRHNVAGDMCKEGTSDLDGALVAALARAYQGRAYTYTHSEMNGRNIRIIRAALEKGFCINCSSEKPEYAARAVKHGIPAVLAWDIKNSGIPAPIDGTCFIQCPQQTRGIKCKDCRLCARTGRKTVIVFDIHGDHAEEGRKLVRSMNKTIPIKAA